MATGTIKNTSIVAAQEEAVEGTYLVPQAATNYIQPLPGFGITPGRETLVRETLNSSPGKVTPRQGIQTVTCSLPVEFRASGTEGADVDFSPLLESALGATRAVAANKTSKDASHSSTEIELTNGDAASFAVGDIVLVKEAGGFEIRPISATDEGTDTNSITFPFALTGGAPANEVVISKVTMFYTANTGHISVSVSEYLANTKRLGAAGCKVTSMSLDNFSTGQIASLNFALEGFSYTMADGVAPHTPSYDSGVPPTILNACLWQDGTLLEYNTFSLNVANTLGYISDACDSVGRTASRVSERVITGTFNPYMDDTSFTNFTNFDTTAEFSLFIQAYVPESTNGITLGSAIGIYLPQCVITEFKEAELDGVMVDEMSFQATRGSAGTSEEMYLGLI